MLMVIRIHNSIFVCASMLEPIGAVAVAHPGSWAAVRPEENHLLINPSAFP